MKSEGKKRHESAELYEGAGRAELAAKERAELEIIGRYLPAAMNDDELVGLVDAEVAAAAAAGVTGPKAMGQVVKAVRDRAGSSADGSRIAALVKERLVRQPIEATESWSLPVVSWRIFGHSVPDNTTFVALRAK